VNDRGSPVAEKNEDHEDDEQNGGTYRNNDVAYGFADGIGGIEGNFIPHAGGKVLGETVEFSDALLVDVEGVGRGELGHGDADGVAAVVVEVGAIVFGAEFGVTDVSETNQGSVGIAFEDDVIELGSFRETANDADTHLEILPGNGGLRTDASGGHFDVLFGQGVDDIVGGEGAASKTNGVEPKAHGVFALSENEHIGDTGYALQRVADIDVEIVADEERGVAIDRIGEDGAAEDEILRRLGDGDADLLHGGREPTGGGVDAILDIDGREVRVASDIEGCRDRADTVVGAGGGDVLHPLGAVDLLLERRGDGRFDGLGTGAGINGGHSDLWRSEVGELSDREGGNADRARKNDEQGADGGKDGTMNKKVDHRKQFSVPSSQC